jgi:hypothetical protein
LMPIGLGGATTALLHGDTGITMLKPFGARGGAGGRAFGGTTAVIGGTGGAGGIGCGGGGGGASTTGGAGGKGGDGYVAIYSW